jgi:SAM-dependent methyltransferase
VGTGGEPSDTDRGYLLDNRAAEAELRFASLSALFNPGTFRHMEDLGIAEGWRCWEVGVGGDSVLRWLADRVGRSGWVTATDIDVRWVEDAIADNLEVRRHDVAADEPLEGPFDLVHARLVLIHLPEREEALRRMVRSLRPGGWLLIEDFDSTLQPFACPDAVGAEQELANKIRAGFRALLTERGAEMAWGRRLPRLFREAGLVDVAADAYFSVAMPAALPMETANVEQIRDALVAGGCASSDEVDAHLAAVASGSVDMATAALISTWGRKP